MKDCFRILIEPEDLIIEDVLRSVSRIEAIILPVIAGQEILLHGFDNTCLVLIEEAFKRNYSTRIGLDDTIFTDENIKAVSNAELIKKVLSLKRSYPEYLNTVNRKRKLIGIKKISNLFSTYKIINIFVPYDKNIKIGFGLVNNL